jgi:hypothetical protein
MLVIRQSQYDALLARHREASVQNAIQSVSKVFPDDPRLPNRPVVEAIVRGAMKRARDFGITGGRETLLFVYLQFEQGEGFESRPGQAWIERVLRDPGLDPGAKMDVIYKRLELAANGGRS